MVIFFIFFMADISVRKNKRDENMQDYIHNFCWSFGICIYWWKSVFRQPVPCKKNAVKLVVFFSTNIILLFLNDWGLFFFKQKNWKFMRILWGCGFHHNTTTTTPLILQILPTQISPYYHDQHQQPLVYNEQG